MGSLGAKPLVLFTFVAVASAGLPATHAAGTMFETGGTSSGWASFTAALTGDSVTFDFVGTAGVGMLAFGLDLYDAAGLPVGFVRGFAYEGTSAGVSIGDPATGFTFDLPAGAGTQGASTFLGGPLGCRAGSILHYTGEEAHIEVTLDQCSQLSRAAQGVLFGSGRGLDRWSWTVRAEEGSSLVAAERGDRAFLLDPADFEGLVAASAPAPFVVVANDASVVLHLERGLVGVYDVRPMRLVSSGELDAGYLSPAGSRTCPCVVAEAGSPGPRTFTLDGYAVEAFGNFLLAGADAGLPLG